VILSAEKHNEIYIPPGFAHGFIVLSEAAQFLYKCGDFYRREDEHGVAWNDPDLGINWRISTPILSERDKLAPRLSEISSELLPVYRQK